MVRVKFSSIGHSLTFVTAHEQQYALPHFRGIGEFQIFASAVQTNDKSRGVVRQHDNGINIRRVEEKLLPYFH